MEQKTISNDIKQSEDKSDIALSVDPPTRDFFHNELAQAQIVTLAYVLL